MKRLILVRHSKSSWKYLDVEDYDRPLKGKGVINSYLVSDFFSDKIDVVDYVFSSSAIRALHTAVIFTESLGVPLDNLFINRSLYEMFYQEFIEFVKGVDNKYNVDMIVLHNPLITSLARELGRLDIENVPTSGLIDLKFNIENWSEFHNEGEVLNYITPKLILNKEID